MEIDRRLNCCPGRVSPEFDESFRAFPGIGATFREKQLAIASHGTIARCGSEPSLRSRLFLRLYSTASESRSVDWSHRSERRKPAQGERENSLPPISDLTRENDRAAANNENIFFFPFLVDDPWDACHERSTYSILPVSRTSLTLKCWFKVT